MKKILLLQAEKIHLSYSKWSWLKEVVILNENIEINHVIQQSTEADQIKFRQTKLRGQCNVWADTILSLYFYFQLLENYLI